MKRPRPALILMVRIVIMNRTLAMTLWLSAALLCSACSDSQQTDSKSDSPVSGRRAGKTASPATKTTATPPPLRAAEEKEAVAVLEQAKAVLAYDEHGKHVTIALFQQAKISTKALAQLAALKMLERLRLDGHDRGFNGQKEPQIVDGDLIHIQELTRLRLLHLGDNYIGDEGLERLKGLTNLEYLFLNDTDITDNGLKHLGGLIHLKVLDLHNTSITNEGLEHLTQFPELKSVNLLGTLVDDAGVRALRAALSKDVTIVYLFESEEPGDDAP